MLVLALMTAPARAQATRTQVTIDDTAPPLVAGSGGSFTSTLGLTNLTSTELPISVTPSSGAGSNCKLTAEPSNLAAAQHTDLTITVAPACAVNDRQGITFTVGVPGQPAAFTVTSAPKPADKPDWSPLNSFWIALVALGMTALITWIVLNLTRRSGPLTYLDSTWSFSDSWASNVTVIGGILTGIFGSSDVVKSLGDNADSAIAVATVGAAVAAAVVAIAPIVLLASKSKAGSVTVSGLLFACALTLTGAYGELWTVYASAHRMSLGGLQDNLIYPTIVAMALLAVYAVRSVIAVIHQGHTAPVKVTSDTILASNMIVTALQQKDDISTDGVEEALKGLRTTEPRLREGTMIVDPFPRRRAPLL